MGDVWRKVILMGPNELLTQVSDKWQEFFKLLHISMQQLIEPEEAVEPTTLFEDTLKQATQLNDEFDKLVDEIRKSL